MEFEPHMDDALSCHHHGANEAVICCVHVRDGVAAKLFVVPADAESECQAWCAECEQARVADEGWYDAADAVAQWSMICSGCYQAAIEDVRDVTTYDPVETPDA